MTPATADEVDPQPDDAEDDAVDPGIVYVFEGGDAYAQRSGERIVSGW